MAKYADITPFYEWLDSIMKEDKKSYPDHNTLMFYEIIDELDSLPEVVRCKDCKHYNIYRLECHNAHMNGYIGIDGFCSYGERREGE